MPDYTEKAEKLNAFVMAYGDTSYSVNAIKVALLEAFEDGLNSAPAPAQPVAAPGVAPAAPSGDSVEVPAEEVLEVQS